MPLPLTPLENALLNNSDSTTVPIYAKSDIAKRDIQGEMQMDELSSSPDAYEKIDFRSPSPQDELLVPTDAKSNLTVANINTNAVQKDELSNELDGYVIENIEFEPSVKYLSVGKMAVAGDKLEAVTTDDQSEYYDFVQVQEILATATKSEAFAKPFSAHQISRLHDRGKHSGDTVTLTEQNTYDNTRSLNTENKQSDRPVLRRVNSSYVHMYKAKSMKSDSDVYTYEYSHHPYVQMCKRGIKCTGVPPRSIKRIGYQPTIHTNTDIIKEQDTYVNFSIIEKRNIFFPPRNKNCTKPMPKRRATFKPPLPPRNIPRPGCFLSAPSARPT